MNESTTTRWHRLLAKLLEDLLIPVGIDVYTEFPVMSEPPEMDILLLRRSGKAFSSEQRKRLPDGIRDSKAKHIILEFKYTESVNESAFRQILCYDYLYRRIQKLKDDEVQSFLLGSKTPRKGVLTKFGYSMIDQKGVYRSENPLLKSVPLLCLNELSNSMHNSFIKCFASRRNEKKSAFNMLMEKQTYSSFGKQLQWTVKGLLQYWFVLGGNMETELTPEKIVEMGKMWEKAVLSGISIEEIVSVYGKEEILAGFTLEDRMAGLSVEDIKEYLKKLSKNCDS